MVKQNRFKRFRDCGRTLAMAIFCATITCAASLLAGAHSEIENELRRLEYLLSHEQRRAELVIVADIGPRILHFGFVDGPNLLGVSEETKGKPEGMNGRGTVGIVSG